MFDFQSIAAMFFVLAMSIFLLHQRKHITIQSIIKFPILYLIMYRTQVGINAMLRFGERHEKAIRFISYISIGLGFIGMAFISVSLVQNLLNILAKPVAQSGVQLVLPFKIKGTFYVPFFYWIISIFLIALVHEFSHGIVANSLKLKLKSTGLAFFGIIFPIIPAAFVEPDEKSLAKRPAYDQLAVYAAGSFANICLAAFSLLLLIVVFNPVSAAVIEPNGVSIAELTPAHDGFPLPPATQMKMQPGELIQFVDGATIKTTEEFTDSLASKKPGDFVRIQTDRASYNLPLAENPEDPAKAFLGVFVSQKTQLARGYVDLFSTPVIQAVLWIAGLFYWLFVLNLGIGLFNLLPLGIVDGGRMWKVVLEKYLIQPRAQSVYAYTTLFFLSLIVINLFLPYFR